MTLLQNFRALLFLHHQHLQNDDRYKQDKEELPILEDESSSSSNKLGNSLEDIDTANKAADPIHHSTADEDVSLEEDQQQKDDQKQNDVSLEEADAKKDGVDIAKNAAAHIQVSLKDNENIIITGKDVSRSIDVVDTCDEGYLKMNPDVAKAVKEGKFQSGLQHWREHGEREGRAPYCEEWLQLSEPPNFDGYSRRRRGENKRTSSTVSLNMNQDTNTSISTRIHHESTNTATLKTQVGAVRVNKAAYAVIHIGPHKTGTTTIQHYSKVLYPELVLDKYEMPWKHLKRNVKPWENQVEFATCFTPELDAERSRHPCRQDLLEAGLNIARQNGHSLLVSAETFAAAEANGVVELKSYLDQAWGNVTIVATYRRYYEWVNSYHHELNNIKQWAAGTKLWQAIQKNETERIYPGIQETLSKHQAMFKHKNPTAVIERYKQIFSNLVVMNYHDKSKDLIERFYCDAIPNAPNACKKAVEMTKTKGEAKINQSYSAVYEELTYAAHRSGMINVRSQKYCEAVTTAIKAHQEKTLKLSSDDFPRACPSSKVLGEIWDITLRSEKYFNKHVNNDLSYEGEGSLLSTSLKDDFDAYVKTSLCHVNVHAILQSQVWRDFFAEVKGNEAADPIHHSTADEDVSLEKDQQQKDVATITLK